MYRVVSIPSCIPMVLESSGIKTKNKNIDLTEHEMSIVIHCIVLVQRDHTFRKGKVRIMGSIIDISMASGGWNLDNQGSLAAKLV